MESWQDDLLRLSDGAQCENQVFSRVVDAANAMGFDYCAYGLRLPLPLSNPKTIVLSNYPVQWQKRYDEAGYVQQDPTVAHGRRSQAPLLWNNDVFEAAPTLWDEARASGLRHGWAQSSLDACGVGGMLTVARAQEAISPAELASKELKLRWLVNIAHLTFSRICTGRLRGSRNALTAREVEILKWTADGKTSGDISYLLSITENTVNFHIKNAITKLETANKTAAVVRAAMLGLLT